MVDIRKIIIIFVIAVLFSVFVFAFIGAIYPQPDYRDFCRGAYEEVYDKVGPVAQPKDCKVIRPTEQVQKNCTDNNGVIEYTYDSQGCAVSYECSTCQYRYEQEMKKHQQYVFYISAVLALIAVFVGMYLPAQANTLNEWVGTGFMLGGAFALFFGTATSYNSLDRYIKPIVLLLELLLVIFIAYKKIGNLRKDKKKK
jgi:TRAP-type uncharacterized transport system fused permease subunit